MHVLFVLVTFYSMVDILLSQAFPPAKAVFSGIAILLSVRFLPQFTLPNSYDILDYYQTIKDVSASYDALLDLFESFGSFLARLDVYTRIPSTTAITEIVVKILVELLSTISLAIQHVKQGRLSEPNFVHIRLINAV